MNRYLLGNLEDGTPDVLVHNGCKKQGRGMVSLFLVAFFALFLDGKAAAQRTDYSGTYYIGGKDYNASTPASNYYLCPTEGWIYYKPTDQWSEDGTTYPNPFLTTFMCRNGVYDASKAIWTIEKAPAPNSDYYYVKQTNTGKYMLCNGQISGTTNPRRMRVHLEAVTGTPDEKALFSIYSHTGNNLTYLVISPKASSGWNGNYKWYTINGGHKPYLVGYDSNGGPEGYTATGGILGLWEENDINAQFYLEPYSPVIIYNEDNLIEIKAIPGATIYYTTNGDEPSLSNGTLYTAAFDPDDDVTTIKAIAYDNGAPSAVATFQPLVLLGNTHKRLIQNQNNAWNTTEFHFYMVPGDDDATNNIIKVNTTSLFRPSMEWYFLNAGNDNTIQYYYIVNNETNKYLCYDPSNAAKGVYMDTYDSSNANIFKFSIVESAGAYNIIPYGLTTGNRFVCKPNSGSNVGNSNANPINLANNSSAHSQWKFILPGTLDKTNPFTVSVPNTNNYTYYRICNVGNSSFYIIPPRTSGNVIASNSNDPDVVNTMNWYFEVAQEANNSDWLTYFHIRNAVTGDYLYFTKDSNNSGACLEMRSTIVSGNEERYMFTWAKTAATAECYYILPKLLLDVSQNQFSALRKADNTGTTLFTNLTRSAGVYAWTYPDSASPFHCAQPEIAYDANQNGYVITKTESDAKIYYTTDGTDPTPSTGTLFNINTDAIDVANWPDPSVTTLTIKAIATRNGDDASTVAIETVNRVATPVITPLDNGTVEITCSTEGASIYYTDDGTEPTVGSTSYIEPFEGVSGLTIKAIAVKGGWINSLVAESGPITFTCATPVIRKTSATTFTIECSFPSSGVTIRYTDDGTEPTTTTGTIYNGAVTFDPNDLPFTVKAIAYAAGYNASAVATQQLTVNLIPGADGYYEIANRDDFVTFITMVNENTENAGANYKITNDIDASGVGEIDVYPFTGELKSVAKADGTFPVISGLSHAIFNTVSGGVVKNIIMQNVNINQSGNVGAICNVADGYSRIYNCGILPSDNLFTSTSQIGSTSGYCGSIVGWLKDDSRVVNCFSFATITGGSTVAGIVGYNDFASTAAVTDGKYADLKTMVMNCMFYGDITGGTSRYPVYGGAKILNIDDSDNPGINNYDFYREMGNVGTLADQNCSWPATEENLTRFEYYRYLLNANRELCGWWVKSDLAPSTLTTAQVQAIEKDGSLMAKWVFDPAIAPYPILKAQGKYTSVINRDPAQRLDPTTKQWVARAASANDITTLDIPDTHGETLGTINVTINAGDHHQGSGATSASLTLTITAMDTLNNDYCYGKVQLPYYNELFGNSSTSDWANKYGGNYTDYAVTGWKILSVNDNDQGTGYTFDTDWEAGCNYADRSDKYKDLYAKSDRVFAQGGYYYVPYGVTAITIEAYWGKAKYLASAGRCYDIITTQQFQPAGQLPDKFPANTGNSVYDAIKTLQQAWLNSGDNTNNGKTVYDNAIVLVGNYVFKNLKNTENFNVRSNNNRVPFTMMSADLDFDNEPDYCFVLQAGQGTTRWPINPVRFDFVPVVKMGWAMRQDGTDYTFGIGIPLFKGHLEVTETAFLHLLELEYDDRDYQGVKLEAPLILNGGKVNQMLTCENTLPDNYAQKTKYIIFGGNVMMDAVSPGPHNEREYYTRHCAINLLGGKYGKVYLSGIYRDINSTPHPDNPHCYIDGGRIGEVAGAAKDIVDGDVTFKVDHSIIDEFYGGGFNAASPVTGSITVTIDRSYVKKYCGGPKFGDMTSGETITTSATGTTFGVYYGAGNGGTNFQQLNRDDNNGNGFWTTPAEWGLGIYDPAEYHSTSNSYYAKYEWDIFYTPSGNAPSTVCRYYLFGAQFATTNAGSVSSTLEQCTVLTNFYGAGNLGGVNGDVTSTLNNTNVLGSAFGAGFSASIEPFSLLTEENYTLPSRNITAGTVDFGDVGDSKPYLWTNKTSIGGYNLSINHPTANDVDGKNYIFTNISLDNLGTVTGSASLTIDGISTVQGNVFGGGDESAVTGNTEVKIFGKTIVRGNIYGGGNMGLVGGNTQVIINGKYSVTGTGTNGGSTNH